MKKNLMIICCFLSSNLIKGQNLKNGLEDLNYITNKIKNNYPSYTGKKNSNYQRLLSHSKKSILKSSDSIFNFLELATTVMFFTDMHLRLLTNQSIIFDSSFCKKKMDEITERINKVKDKNEGYWISDYNDIIIYLKKPRKEKKLLYEGVIVEAIDKNIKPGNVKFYITNNKITKYNVAGYITTKGAMVGVYSNFQSNDTLLTGAHSKWIKLNDYHTDFLKNLVPYENKVDFNIIDSNYISIKIPKSDFEAQYVVDSLVKQNKDLLENTPNLIIDVRNNSGGSWYVYNSLFPYIYTNPIYEGDSYLKCSEDFIEAQKQLIEDCKKDSNLKQFLKSNEQLLDSMNNYKGEYYYTRGSIVFKSDSIKKNPQKVIILTNYRCGSSTEMFIKFCQQSKKTIIAGEKTWGALDNVEIIPFLTPSGKYKLYIPRIKMVYGKNPPLDFIGISPDISIPTTEADWYKFIIDYFKYMQ